jgi:hypothetical protein
MVKRHARFIGSMAAGVVLLSSAVAFANRTTIQDPKGDGEDVLDIKSASHGHTKTGKLVHKMVAYSNFGPAKAKKITIGIYTAGADYSVSTYGIYNSTTGTTSSVTVKRPSGNTIKYIFPKWKIGNPSSYDWHVFTVPGYSCPTCPDYAPNMGYVTHNL